MSFYIIALIAYLLTGVALTGYLTILHYRAGQKPFTDYIDILIAFTVTLIWPYIIYSRYKFFKSHNHFK